LYNQKTHWAADHSDHLNDQDLARKEATDLCMADSPDPEVNIFLCPGLVPHTKHPIENLFYPIDHSLLNIHFSSSGSRLAVMDAEKLPSIISGIKLFENFLLSQVVYPVRIHLPYVLFRCKYIERPRLILHRAA